MAEQVFRSPGFFEREIDLSERSSEITGVPAGIVGTAQMGPAFVPVTVGSFTDFVNRFGEADLDKNQFGPLAVKEFLKNRTAATFIRVLGAGTNEGAADFEATRLYGYVRNAGFTVIGGNRMGKASAAPGPTGDGLGETFGGVKFIVATHFVSASGEGVAYPQFSDNNTFDLSTSSNLAHLVRGMVFLATGTNMRVIDADHRLTGNLTPDVATVGQNPDHPMYKQFKLMLSSSSGANFGNDDGFAGVRILTASLDPAAPNYISKILNTDPRAFQTEEHLLYGDFAVESEVAELHYHGQNTVGIASGSLHTNPISSVVYQDLYGRFDTRYRNARTTDFISQPFGSVAGKEYSLFHFETISDGSVVNERFKVSIANIKRSTDPKNPYGTFTVLVRNFEDSDTNIQVLEQYGNCTLNPNDEDYIAKKIGDFKAFYNFDAGEEKERRVVISGKYPNVSSRIRVIMNRDVERGDVPGEALPFGFKGLPIPKTLDNSVQGTLLRPATSRLSLSGSSYGQIARNLGIATGHVSSPLSSSVLPPVPMTFKVTRGNIDPLDGTLASSGPVGHPGMVELADARYYWGIKTTRVPKTGSLAKAILNPNASDEVNPLIRSYSKFLGLAGLDTVVTGSGADTFHNNKFSLAKVALGNRKDSYPSVTKTVENYLTASPGEHMREAAYIRNNASTASDGTINDGVVQGRLSLLSLMNLTASLYFNKFTEFAKFTNIFYGGFDGVNILDPDMADMNDRACSAATTGKANTDLDIGMFRYVATRAGGEAFTAGIGNSNNHVNSYKAAVKIMTDPMVSRINILAVPGQRDQLITDFALSTLSDYGRAIYLLDLPSFNSNSERIFDNDGKRPDTESTREKFLGRGLDNNFAATYYPDVSLRDTDTGRVIAVPSSIAALSALGFNDSVAYPWFAPAGFNRAALNEVVNVGVRLNKADRDDLYDAKINPIASFPGAGFVIFGQKTLQQARSALDRVNVRRMLLEVKRLVENVANDFVFEQNTSTMRAKFVSQVTPLLATVQNQQGIDQFRVTMDDSNNTQADIEANRLNGRIVIVPTRAVEFISIDFIITNSGVSFE